MEFKQKVKSRDVFKVKPIPSTQTKIHSSALLNLKYLKNLSKWLRAPKT
jgi:hypothetical protein